MPIDKLIEELNNRIDRDNINRAEEDDLPYMSNSHLLLLLIKGLIDENKALKKMISK